MGYLITYNPPSSCDKILILILSDVSGNSAIMPFILVLFISFLFVVLGLFMDFRLYLDDILEGSGPSTTHSLLAGLEAGVLNSIP